MAKTNMENNLEDLDSLFASLCVRRKHLDDRSMAFKKSELGMVLRAAHSESYDALVLLRKEITDGRL